MLSKILIKLIDKAIIPATLLLASRIISIILVSKHLGIYFEITRDGFIFQNSYDYLKVNSYSILFMVVVLVIGLGYVVVKALLFHSSHIKPTTTAKLFSIKAQSLIQNSYEIYTQGSVWLSYSYLLLILTAVMAMSNLVYPWVFYSILGVSILVTLIFIFDAEEEIKMKKNEEWLDNDQKYLEKPGELE